jgi:hypothetical protein
MNLSGALGKEKEPHAGVGAGATHIAHRGEVEVPEDLRWWKGTTKEKRLTPYSGESKHGNGPVGEMMAGRPTI